MPRELLYDFKVNMLAHSWDSIIQCEELTHLKRPWSWERLKAGGEGDDWGWDGWMASLTRWTWVWVNSRSWWWTGRPGVLQSMGSQRVGHNWATELNWKVDVLAHSWTPLSSRVEAGTGNWILKKLSCHRFFSAPPNMGLTQLCGPQLQCWAWSVTHKPSMQLEWILCLFLLSVTVLQMYVDISTRKQKFT